MAQRHASPERVKFFMRVDPEDVSVFRAVRDAVTRAERRRVVDAEAFRLAVRAWVASLPPDVRRDVERAQSSPRRRGGS